jgi:AcrR family transcriptional regulator
MTSTHAASDAAFDSLSLRERKKIKTRRAIRREAYRLFAAQGYDATTVEQICDAAEVSPSTFFRYFPTKEDVVVTDEYDSVMKEGLRARPADEPLIESLRHVMRTLLNQYLVNEIDEVLARNKLYREVPALRSRMAEGLGESHEALREILAERTGRDKESLEVRVVCGALIGALMEGFLTWPDNATPSELLAITERALDVLARGLETS